MKKLSIVSQRIPTLSWNNDFPQIASLLDNSTQHLIDQDPWQTRYPGLKVRFAIANDQKAIFLKYYVQEKNIRAKHHQYNSTVYEDSCVEFFVRVPETELYYNFEFNCIGTCLAEKGRSRKKREKLSTDLIGKIKTFSTLGDKPFEIKSGNFQWQLTVRIPLIIFNNNPQSNPQSQTFRANFYKCGDQLENPHYLCWHSISLPEPDFHCPDFFGEITLL